MQCLFSSCLQQRTDLATPAPVAESITSFGHNEVLEVVKAFQGMLVQPRAVYALAKALDRALESSNPQQ
eukprot:1336700-Amphidinium_carterae.1